MARRRYTAVREKEAKLWGGRFEEGVTDAVERFSESVSFDKALYKHDIMGSIAHAKMLAAQIFAKQSNISAYGVRMDAEIFAFGDGVEEGESPLAFGNDKDEELPNGQADDISLGAKMLAVGEGCGNGEIAIPDKLNKIMKSSESLNEKIEKAMLEKKEEVKEEFERVNAMLVDKEQVQKKLDEVKMVVNELELENISWKPNPPAASKKK